MNVNQFVQNCAGYARQATRSLANRLGIANVQNPADTESGILSQEASAKRWLSASGIAAGIAAATFGTPLMAGALAVGSLGAAAKALASINETKLMREVEQRVAKAQKPDIKFFGLGLSRTGTVSLAKALQDLMQIEEKDVWHGLDCFSDPVAMACWDMFDKTGNERYLYAALENKMGAIEFPIYAHAERLLTLFPEAKFILTTRDPISWATSVKENLFREEDKARAPILRFLGMYSRQLNAVRRFGASYEMHVEQNAFHGEVKDITEMAKAMQAHTEKMQNTIPAEKLLILPAEMDNASKLTVVADFMQIDVPEHVSYEHTNSGATIRETAERIIRGQPFSRTGEGYS